MVKPRSPFLQFMDKALTLVDGLKGVAMILAALSVGGASGTLIAGGADEPRLDSLEARQDSLEIGFGQMQRNQLEMYSAQIEADTTLKAVLEGRAANRRKAETARAETEKLFNDLVGAQR